MGSRRGLRHPPTQGLPSDRDLTSG